MTAQNTTGPAQMDLDTGTITRTVKVRAPRDVVWHNLTTPEQVEIWWGHPMRFPDGIRAGSLGVFEYPGHPDFPVRIDRVDSPTHFGLTWGSGASLGTDTATSVLFELTTDTDGATVVTVTETGFLDHPDAAIRRREMDENVDGWNEVLDSLVKHVESASA